MMCCTRRSVRRHVLFTISNYKKTGSNAAANDMWGTAAGTGIIRSFFGLRRPRGAVVPFEAPALNMARVCDDERDGLIAILRDFANNGSAYIVPWTSLPLMMSMTERDKALHKAVEESKPSTPAEVRAVVTSLALTGALGPDARARELALTQSDQSGLADLELILILHLLDSCGADVSRLLASEDRWRDKYARSVVTAAATAIGVRRQEIHQRVAEFGKLLQPIGLTLTDAPIRPGWLRVLHDEIKGFGHNLLFAPERGSPDCGGYLVAIAESANGTARLSGTVLAMIDYAVLDIRGTMRRWTTELPVLRLTIDRLSQTLDEWPPLMKLTHDALRGSKANRIAQLRMLLNMLPQLPDPEPAEKEAIQDGLAAPDSVSRALEVRLSSIWSMLRTAEPLAT